MYAAGRYDAPPITSRNKPPVATGRDAKIVECTRMPPWGATTLLPSRRETNADGNSAYSAGCNGARPIASGNKQTPVTIDRNGEIVEFTGMPRGATALVPSPRGTNKYSRVHAYAMEGYGALATRVDEVDVPMYDPW